MSERILQAAAIRKLRAVPNPRIIDKSLRLAIIEIPEQVLVKESLLRALHDPKKKGQCQKRSESCG